MPVTRENQRQESANKSAKRRKGSENRTGPQSETNVLYSAQSSIWEWITAAIGTVLLLLLLAFLIHQSLYGSKAPAEIRVTAGKVISQNDGYLVKFFARNIGDEPAAAVSIQGQLKTNANQADTSQTVIDYIPGQSERAGGLFFRSKPSLSNLEIRALGYQDP
jgi:uncharacterized protein (TIGR02588 family)